MNQEGHELCESHDRKTFVWFGSFAVNRINADNFGDRIRSMFSPSKSLLELSVFGSSLVMVFDLVMVVELSE